jgi:hypothetical protein
MSEIVSSGVQSVVVDVSPFGSRAPGLLDRIALALTRSMPNNWLGMRLAILFRRYRDQQARPRGNRHETLGHAAAALSTGNGCEKNALFTPQMFDVMERGILAAAIDCACSVSSLSTSAPMSDSIRCSSRRVAESARASLQSNRSPHSPRLRFNLAANPDSRLTWCRLRSRIAQAW